MTTPAARRILATLLFFCPYWLAPSCFGQDGHSSGKAKPLATVDGQPIFEQDLLPLVQPELRQLANQEFAIKSKALQTLVNQKLLEAEAKKRGISVQKLLERQAGSAAAEPTQRELEAYYLGQEGAADRPFAEVKAQLRQALKQAKLERAQQEYLARLRQRAQVSVLLQPPKFEIGYDPARLRGTAVAPVTIVEFSDFQCPFCRGVEPTLKALLAKYPDQVSLAYRDFPLSQIHSQAQKAAEAARCAGAQGRFWEYHDLLFASPSKLDLQGLFEDARSLRLDEKEFSACLTSGKYKGEVDKDLRDGTQYGISGTPAFFINGVFLDGAQSARTFENAIEQALAGKRAE